MRGTHAIASLLLIAACGHHDGNNGGGGGGGGGGATDSGPTGPDAFAGPWNDFSPMPVMDPSAPANAATLFGAPGSGSAGMGPCLVEPEVGTLYPQNWLRPRFSWVATGSENLFELRLTAANQVNPLVVYTTATTWTMPADTWTALSNDTVGQPITVTVRGATYDGVSALTGGPEVGSTGDVAIAPATAPGAIVYWTTSGGTALRGFHIGDESVTTIVQPADDGATTKCIGCHSSTPGGSYVAYSATADAGNGDPAWLGLVSSDATDQHPSFISASATTLMQRQGQESPSFSPLHWQDGDHVAMNMFTVNSKFEIMWTDLEATSTAQGTGWGVITRTGDTNAAAYASFAHTTDNIVYVSSPSVASGVTSKKNGDIFTVPYGNRQGGMATSVKGADTAENNEYYPTFSPDDRYIAFNRAPAAQSSYANANAEVYVIPATGGTPTRIAANDPTSCAGKTSPGIENSWPKWAPEATFAADGKTYYWLTFSSTRAGGIPQLFVTPVVDDGSGTLTTYPALYLWNQPATDHNHTPAWDNFQIVIQ